MWLIRFLFSLTAHRLSYCLTFLSPSLAIFSFVPLLPSPLVPLSLFHLSLFSHLLFFSPPITFINLLFFFSFFLSRYFLSFLFSPPPPLITFSTLFLLPPPFLAIFLLVPLLDQNIYHCSSSCFCFLTNQHRTHFSLCTLSAPRPLPPSTPSSHSPLGAASPLAASPLTSLAYGLQRTNFPHFSRLRPKFASGSILP